MSRLLTVFHVFYHEQVDYFIDKLVNINGIEWDLIVTYSSYSELTEVKIRTFKQDAIFRQVDNVGYDVWPFIQVLRDADFSLYDYVLKLHTKGQTDVKLNGLRLNKWLWRDLLVDSMLLSKSRFRACLKLLEDRKSVGMICSYELHMGIEGALPEDSDMLSDEAERISLKYIDGHFCAGTMFLARMSALKKIKKIDFNSQMWGRYNKSNANGTLAHVYERIFGLLIKDAGYKIIHMMSRADTSTLVTFRNHIYPMLQKIFMLNRDAITGDKIMTLMGMEFTVSKFKKK